MQSTHCSPRGCPAQRYLLQHSQACSSTNRCQLPNNCSDGARNSYRKVHPKNGREGVEPQRISYETSNSATSLWDWPAGLLGGILPPRSLQNDTLSILLKLNSQLRIRPGWICPSIPPQMWQRMKPCSEHKQAGAKWAAFPACCMLELLLQGPLRLRAGLWAKLDTNTQHHRAPGMPSTTLCCAGKDITTGCTHVLGTTLVSFCAVSLRTCSGQEIITAGNPVPPEAVAMPVPEQVKQPHPVQPFSGSVILAWP